MAEASDGYVKFQSNHSTGVLPPNPLLPALDQARTRLWDWGLVGVYPNGIGYGNVSVRHGQGFIISGTATGGRRILGEAGYCWVRDYRLGQNLVHSEGPVPASSEAMSHGAIYAAAPEVGCVLHVHNQPIWEALLRGGWPATPAEIAYGTPAMAWALKQLVVELRADSACIVMAGHAEGIIAYGRTIDLAMEQITGIRRFLKGD